MCKTFEFLRFKSGSFQPNVLFRRPQDDHALTIDPARCEWTLGLWRLHLTVGTASRQALIGLVLLETRGPASLSPRKPGVFATASQ